MHQKILHIWRETTSSVAQHREVQEDQPLRDAYRVVLGQAQSATAEFRWLGEPELFYSPTKSGKKPSFLRYLLLLPTAAVFIAVFIWCDIAGQKTIQRLILEDAVVQSSQHETIQRVFNEFPTWHSFCELKARKLKESYFIQEDLWEQQPCVETVSIWADVNAPLNLRLSLDTGKVDRLLNTPMEGAGSQTFLERLWECLRVAAERTSAHPPKQLILTGGASRMRFFQKACQQAFPEARVTVCRDPEFSIARGLSIAARLDDSLERFRGRIDGFFKDGVLRDDISENLHFLIPELIPVLEKRIMEKCVEPVRRAKDMDPLQRQEELRECIRKEFQEHPYSPETDAIVAKWISDRLVKSQEELDRICRESDVDRADMRLAKLGIQISLDKLYIRLGQLPAFLDRLRQWLNIGKTPRKRVREALDRELNLPGGTFAKRLAGDLEADLRKQIQKNIEKVEIHIH